MMEESLLQVQQYVEENQYKGYDPYDTLNSFIPFNKFGKWIPIFATQFQKRNPFNIRPYIGIFPETNPKAIGLFLHSYSILQKQYPKKDYLPQLSFLFDWLLSNSSSGYKGKCWGYNFDWSSPVKYIKAHVPNIVVTCFIAKGIFEYYQLTKNSKALSVLESICGFITTDIGMTETDQGICFSYSPVMNDCCYNASLLGAEILVKTYSISKNEAYLTLAQRAVDFVISKQHDDGHWNYSIDSETGIERKQIDFHQGYILDSIFEFINYSGINADKYNLSLKKGLSYYQKEQFHANGQSKWRIPKEFPVEIHNQSQGIITFSRVSQRFPEYLPFAKTIANWTIENMQNKKKGYFYYRKNKYFTNKIPYMRWSQAWMMLALSELKVAMRNNKT